MSTELQITCPQFTVRQLLIAAMRWLLVTEIREITTKGEFQSIGEYTSEVGLRLGMGVAWLFPLAFCTSLASGFSKKGI